MLALAVVSGKGGVGKSLVASTIVQALANGGVKVGAIDADFSNPNLRKMLGLENTDVTIDENKKLHPVQSGNISFFTIETIAQDRGVGMTADEYAEIIRDVLENGVWDVEYMVVDLPAVISGEFRAILRQFENNYVGSIVVAQPAHLATTERVFKLHQINGVPVIGAIENMVDFECEHGSHYQLFGASGLDALASKYGVMVLGKLPLSMDVERAVAEGKPVMFPGDDVLDATVKAVLGAKPKELGFVQEMKAKIKQFTTNFVVSLMVQSVQVISKEVDIGSLQAKHHFPGGQNIGFVLMDERMETALANMNFRIENGKLVIVKQPPKLDTYIYIKAQALAWAILGRKKFPDGTEVNYDIVDAWMNGDAKVYGNQAVVKAISFYKDMWESSRAKLKPKLEPILTRLA